MDGTYAPQSPDLSGFQSSPKKQQPLHHPQQSSYAPRSPIIPSYNQHQNPAYEQSIPSNQSYEFGQYNSSQYMPPIPALPPSHSFHPASNFYQTPLQSYTNHETKQSYAIHETKPLKSLAMSAPAAELKDPNPLNIEIKTKFPVARIKRIMQADEEVGKVAQVTPVAVNRALELFMIRLVTGAAEKVKEKGGKRVTAQHLKSVIESDEQFDFLNDIVAKVAEAQEPEGRKKRKETADTDEEKPKKGKGRRKKSDD